jgi:hypothetical protein
MKNNNPPRTRLLLLAPALFTLVLGAETTFAQSDTPNSKAILRAAKKIYVTSSSFAVGEAVIESKLRKCKEFEQFGLVITRDAGAADLILEVRHDIFTKYVYSAVDPNTNMVVASGKLSSLGGTVAGKVAKRFMKEIARAHAQPGP